MTRFQRRTAGEQRGRHQAGSFRRGNKSPVAARCGRGMPAGHSRPCGQRSENFWRRTSARRSVIVRRELQRRGTNPFRAAVGARLPGNAIRYVLEGREPKVGRMAEVCDALGLEFYIGPPRGRPADATGEDEAVQAVETRRPPQGHALWDRLRATAQELNRLLEPAAAADDAAPAQPAAAAGVIDFPVRRVDRMALSVAAGGGAAEMDEAVVDHLTFRRDWLDRNGLDPSQCTVVDVQGESMEPTLPEGCTILVDRGRRRRRTGGIFVVRSADGVVVKRAGKDASGGWLLLSDHPAWEPVPWPRDAVVIGEVKWMGMTL